MGGGAQGERGEVRREAGWRRPSNGGCGTTKVAREGGGGVAPPLDSNNIESIEEEVAMQAHTLHSPAHHPWRGSLTPSHCHPHLPTHKGVVCIDLEAAKRRGADVACRALAPLNICPPPTSPPPPNPSKLPPPYSEAFLGPIAALPSCSSGGRAPTRGASGRYAQGALSLPLHPCHHLQTHSTPQGASSTLILLLEVVFTLGRSWEGAS